MSLQSETVEVVSRVVVNRAAKRLVPGGKFTLAGTRTAVSKAMQALGVAAVVVDDPEAFDADASASGALLAAAEELVYAIGAHDNLHRRIPGAQTVAHCFRSLPEAVQERLASSGEAADERSSSIHDVLLVELRELAVLLALIYPEKNRSGRQKAAGGEIASTTNTLWSSLVVTVAALTRYDVLLDDDDAEFLPRSRSASPDYDAAQERLIAGGLAERVREASDALGASGRSIPPELLAEVAEFGLRLEEAARELRVDHTLDAVEQELNTVIPDEHVDRSWVEALSRLTTDGEQHEDVQAARGMARAALEAIDSGAEPATAQLEGLKFLHGIVEGGFKPSPSEVNDGIGKLLAAGLTPALVMAPLLPALHIGEPDEELALDGSQEGGERPFDVVTGPEVRESEAEPDPSVTNPEIEAQPEVASAQVLAVKAEPAPEARSESAHEIMEDDETPAEDSEASEAEAQAESALSTAVTVETSPLSVSISDPEVATASGVDDTIIAALNADELSLAYWAARLAGDSEYFPPEVLEAAALSVSLGPERDPTADALERALSRVLESRAHVGGPAGLIVLAAAMRGALVSPYGSAPTVLREAAKANAIASMAPSLGEAATLIADRAQSGDLAELGTSVYARQVAELERLVVDCQRTGQEGREKWPHEKHSYQPAQHIWRRWATGSGDLATLIDLVAENRVDTIERAERIVGAWTTEKQVARQIDDAFATLRSAHRDKLEARARKWLVERVGRAVALGQNWAHRSRELARVRSQQRGADIATVREQLRRLDGPVRAELAELLGSTASISAAVRLLENVWDGLLQLAESGDPGFGFGRPVMAALNGGLVRVADASLDAECAPVPGSNLAHEQLVPAMVSTWEEAFQRRMVEHHHVATSIAISEMSRDGIDTTPLAEVRDSDLAAARAVLERRVRDLDLRSSRLLRCAVLPAAEHARLAVELEDLRMNPPDAVPVAQRAVDEVERRLSELADRRTAELTTRLGHARPDDADRGRIDELIREEQYDVAEELTQLLEGGGRLPVPESRTDVLEEFLRALEVFGATGARPLAVVEARGRIGDLDFAEFDEGAVKEALEAVRALGRMSPGLSQSLLGTALRVIGVAVGLDVVGNSLKTDRGLPKFITADLSAAAVGASWTPPEFGSRTGMDDQGRPGRFRLVVGTGAINEKELIEIIKRQAGHSDRPVLALVKDPLPVQRRKALERLARSERVAFLLVDAYSLLFQPVGRARSGASPFDVLLATSLPFGWLQPYVPQGAVPPEMFFGREDELERLLDPFGSCFIYGGRQLGKSALLRVMRARAHSPADHRFCTLIDLKGEGIGSRLPADAIWAVIARHLSDDGLTAVADTNDREGFSRELRRWIDSMPHAQVRLLLDESDDFMEQDAPGFLNVMALRTLMEDTDRRFKVVLAGLHSVNRFSRIPNQPLAQFGANAPIGPLDWTDARRLVETPMHLAGFRFDPPQLVDRILVEARRHPSLVQFVCQAVLEHYATSGAARRQQAPIAITAADLDEVFERSAYLRDRIRERFEWTLNLDKRYRVLALLLAEQSLADDEVRAGGLPARQLWDLALDMWAGGFSNLSRDEFDVLLEEMVNLEVFAVSDGQYRLPAVNVLRLLGNHDEITDRLLQEIEADGMPESPNPERLRRPLEDSDKARRSPLTFGDERSLLGREGPPIRVVFGTAATHVERLRQAFDRCAACGEWPEVELDVQPQLDLEGLARRYQRRERPSARVLHAGRLAVASKQNVVDAVEQFWALLEKLAERELAGQVAVVAFVDHTSAEHWADLRESLELELAGEARIVTLKKWDLRQLGVWLDELDLVVPNESDRVSIMELTGGWPALTEPFATLRTANETVEETLGRMRNDGEFAELAAVKLGIDGLPLAPEIIGAMHEYGDALDAGEIAGLLDTTDLSTADLTDTVETLALQGVVQRAGHGYQLDPVAARFLRQA